MIDKIKEYFEKNCELVSGRRLNVNCLDSKLHSCTIEPVPSSVVIKKYPDGGELREYPFVFATREYFDPDVCENLKTALFYEKFADWIQSRNQNGDLPILKDGCEAVCFEIMSTGYLYRTDEPKARYQIQLRLIYEKD